MAKKKYLIISLLLIFILAITPVVGAFQIKLHDRGKDVIEVQKYLEILGYKISADGVCGKGTEAAIEDFQKKNQLQTDGIVGGKTYQFLKKMISEKVSYELYIVDKGDTLSEIARKNNINLDKLMKFNNLNSVKIKTGDDIKIPRNDIITSEQNINQEKNEQKTKINYTIRRGDTLSSIAAQKNLPVEKIMTINNLKSDFIEAGQKLVLPKENFKRNEVRSKSKKDNSVSSKEIIHTVQRGDALSTIARMYGTNIDTIRRNNSINGDQIFAGDKLIITNYKRGPFVLGRNAFRWPVNGRITSNFGWRNHPIKKTKLFHNGLDIAVPTGTSVKAAAAGKVVHSGWINGFGYTVIIDHGNDVETLYAHNSRVTVSLGAMVNKGQQVALSGNTGLSTGPHLHFGVLKNEKPLNPRDYLP